MTSLHKNTKTTAVWPKTSWTVWVVPAALIFLSAIPVWAGTVRLIELSGGAEITAENARFFAAPWPVIIHIITVTFYSMLGAFQFVAYYRRRWPGWHRTAGRFLLACGLLTALSGLWMTQFYPWPALDGVALYMMRLVVGAGMLLSLLLAVLAIRQRNFGMHGAWMIRAYALAMGAGTQVFTHIPLAISPDLLNETTRALAMGAGWLINIMVAEWVIAHQRRPNRRSRRDRSRHAN